MHKQSLQKNSFFHILRLSFLYSLLIAALLSFLNLKFLQADKEKQIVTSIQQFLNSYEGSGLSKNLPLLVQRIQQLTSLQEILIYDSKCNLLAGSVLTLKNICQKNEIFKLLRFNYAEEEISIFFNYDYSIYDYIRQTGDSGIYWLFGIFITTAAILYSFLYFSILKPLQVISQELEESTLPEELSFFQIKIMELKKQILQEEEDRTYLKTSKKVIHDIRNPLLYLRKLVEGGRFSESELIEKLNDVDFQISSILNKGESSINEISLHSFLSNLKDDCKKMFNLELVVSRAEKLFTVITLDQRHLKNILLNLSRNSFEANASHLVVDWEISVDEKLCIHFRDDGIGFDKNNQELIMKYQFTTKLHGNGIGLQSAKEKLNSIGGDLQIRDSLKGAYFVLEIPLFKPGSEIALIDDDKFIHASWKSHSDNNFLVHTFFSVDDFLTANLSSDISVFIDSDLGKDESGEAMSQKIFIAGYTNIYLATSFCDIKLTDYPWIKCLAPKSGPFTRIT